MHLVLLLTGYQKHQKMLTAASLKAFRRHVGKYQGLTTVGPGGDINVDLSTPGKIYKAMYHVSQSPLVDDVFVVMENTTILTGPVDPAQNAPSVTGGWAHHPKGLFGDAMIATLQVLLNEELDTYVYETGYPQTFDKGKLSAMFSDTHGLSLLFRTLYHNTYPSHNKKALPRVEPGFVKLWRHGMQAPSPVAAICDTCLVHPECIKWFEKGHGLH